MILCVNPNASIDKTVTVDQFQVNAIHRPSFELSLAGGKGCNVARAARILGQPAMVTGWVGGYAGRFIEHGLHAEGIGTAFVRTREESRTCLSIYDPVLGTMTEIYEKGRAVTAKEVQAFYILYRKHLARASLVTLSDSLPPGAPVDLYAELIHMARAVGVSTVLDSSGEPLRVGWQQGRPSMLKCNRTELSELVGQNLVELEDLVRVVKDLAGVSGGSVVVTLGALGAVAVEVQAQSQQTWLAQPPRVNAASAVGSGDAVLAGLACGILEKRAFKDALCLGIAAGAANTLILGAGRLRKEDVDSLVGQVRVAAAG